MPITHAVLHAPPSRRSSLPGPAEQEPTEIDATPRQLMMAAFKLLARRADGTGSDTASGSAPDDVAAASASHTNPLRALGDPDSILPVARQASDAMEAADAERPGTHAAQIYERIDRADANNNILLDNLFASIDAKDTPLKDGASPHADPASDADSANNTPGFFGQNHSLSEINKAFGRAWRFTKTDIWRLWRSKPTSRSTQHHDASNPTRDVAAPDDAEDALQLLHFGNVGLARAGMMGLFLLHGLSAVPLVLAIFRWPAAESHDSCKPPSSEQLPEAEIYSRQSIMTAVATIGTAIYASRILARHWARLSLRGRLIACSAAAGLIATSGLLTMYDKTITIGRMMAGFIDKYLEIHVTHGWTAEAGPGANDRRTIGAWGAIITLSLFVTHQIRAGIFAAVDKMLALGWLSPSVEILLRALGKITSEVIAFGAMMPTLMAAANTFFGSRFIMRRASRAIVQSLENMISRVARVIRGEDTWIDLVRDLGRNLIRPLRKREFGTKFIAWPGLGHNTVCAGGEANMSVLLWLLNSIGEGLLEMFKAKEALTFEQARQNTPRSISLVGDFLQIGALPSERVRDGTDSPMPPDRTARTRAQSAIDDAASPPSHQAIV